MSRSDALKTLQFFLVLISLSASEDTVAIREPQTVEKTAKRGQLTLRPVSLSGHVLD